jgi:hypothetical protein
MSHNIISIENYNLKVIQITFFHVMKHKLLAQ